MSDLPPCFKPKCRTCKYKQYCENNPDKPGPIGGRYVDPDQFNGVKR